MSLPLHSPVRVNVGNGLLSSLGAQSLVVRRTNQQDWHEKDMAFEKSC